MHFDRPQWWSQICIWQSHLDQSIHTGQTGLHSRANFDRQHMPPLFFGKACVPKNTPMDQNCLRTMINDIHQPFFVLRAIKNYRTYLALLQVDDEIICFGLQIFFMIIGFVGSTSTCCSIDSCLRKCCSLLFWVWDKPEGHHLGGKYFEFFFTSFSPFLLQLRSFSIRLLLIGLWKIQFGYIEGYWL